MRRDLAQTLENLLPTLVRRFRERSLDSNSLTWLHIMQIWCDLARFVFLDEECHFLGLFRIRDWGVRADERLSLLVQERCMAGILRFRSGLDSHTRRDWKQRRGTWRKFERESMVACGVSASRKSSTNPSHTLRYCGYTARPSST